MSWDTPGAAGLNTRLSMDCVSKDGISPKGGIDCGDGGFHQGCSRRSLSWLGRIHSSPPGDHRSRKHHFTRPVINSGRSFNGGAGSLGRTRDSWKNVCIKTKVEDLKKSIPGHPRCGNILALKIQIL